MGRLVLSVCLLSASVSCWLGVAVGMAGRGCFSSVPRGSCGLPLRVRLSVWPAVLVARLVVCLVAPMCLLGGVRRAWASRACVSLSPDTHFAPSSVSRGGAIFSSLAGFSVVPLIDEECGHIAGHDTRHRVRRVVRPILDLVAGRLCFHEVIGRWDELVVHTVEGLADGRANTADIDEFGSALNDLIESGLVRIATVVLCENVSDLDALDVLHCVVLSIACSLSTSIE